MPDNSLRSFPLNHLGKESELSLSLGSIATPEPATYAIPKPRAARPTAPIPVSQ